MNKIKKTETQKNLQRAEELMRTYAQSKANKAELMATIKNEIDAYTKNMKDAEEELVKLGLALRDQFDTKDNLVLEHGYLHEAKKAIVTTGKKFDLCAFISEYPEMIEVTMKVAPITKAFLDKDQRKGLKAFYVDVTTEKVIEVKQSKA